MSLQKRSKASLLGPELVFSIPYSGSEFKKNIKEAVDFSLRKRAKERQDFNRTLSSDAASLQYKISKESYLSGLQLITRYHVIYLTDTQFP